MNWKKFGRTFVILSGIVGGVGLYIILVKLIVILFGTDVLLVILVLCLITMFSALEGMDV